MTIFITKEDTPIIKESYLNLSHYALISVPQIFEEFGYQTDNKEISEYSVQVINNKILDMIIRGVKIKRFVGIIYSNPDLNERGIEAIIRKFNTIDGVTDVVFLDKDDKEYREYYKHFNRVSFYPTVKKIKLLKAIKFDSKMFYWVNDDDFADEQYSDDKME